MCERCRISVHEIISADSIYSTWQHDASTRNTDFALRDREETTSQRKTQCIAEKSMTLAFGMSEEKNLNDEY